MSQFSLTTATNLFKTKFGKLSDNTYNSANVLLGRAKKTFDFTGKQKFVPVPLSFSGGVGSGTLPTSNVNSVDDALITAKKVYATTEIDREAIYAAQNDEGAFVRMTKFAVQRAVESYMRNMSRILWGDGTGLLGVIDAGGVVDNGGGNYTLTITAASWKEANFEEKDYVNIETGNTDLFEIEEVDPDNTAITVQRITGSQVPVATDEIFMQGSEDNDPQGLKGVLEATSGSLYTIPVQRRWRSTLVDAAAAGLTTDAMNETMLEVQRKCGKVPNLIVTSFTQYRKLLNILEDQKQYVIEPRSPELKGKVSFRGVEFMSSAGPVGVFADRFCPDDQMAFLNDNYISMEHRPGFGWFDDDGTVFLRKSDSDAYEARYGGYLEIYIPPTFHGLLDNLAV